MMDDVDLAHSAGGGGLFMFKGLYFEACAAMNMSGEARAPRAVIILHLGVC